MATRWLIRWSGLVLIVGAVVLVIHQVSHPLGEAAAYTREATWVPSHLLGYLAFQLLAFGVVGLYARQAQATGSLGLVAFVLTTVGLVIAAGGQLMVGAVLQPLTAARTPELWDPDGPVSIDRSVRLVFGLANLWVPGLVLMAIATDLPAPSFIAALQLTAEVTAGGLLLTLFSIAAWPLQRYGPER